MIRLLAVFLFGVITGALALMVVSCLWASSQGKREEELKEWERKLP